MQIRNAIVAGLAIGAGATAAQASGVIISEILGSTSGSDAEFIELVNTGAAPVDISNWSIELWDSDTGGSFGSADASSPYFVPAGTILGPGGTFTFGNSNAETFFGAIFDESLPANAVENSSYTAVLADAGSSLVEAIFVTDGDAGDAANRGGTPITADFTVGPDGSFLPAGFYRIGGPKGTSTELLNFSTGDLNDGTLAGGTPGFNQVPTPGALALAGIAGLAMGRRRRA